MIPSTAHRPGPLFATVNMEKKHFLNTNLPKLTINLFISQQTEMVIIKQMPQLLSLIKMVDHLLKNKISLRPKFKQELEVIKPDRK